MRNIILIVLLHFSIQQIVYCDTYKLIDACSGLEVNVEVLFEINPNDRLVIASSNNKEYLDSVVYSGLAWRETITIIDSVWLKIELPLKGGLGRHWKKRIILQVCQGMLVESLNITSYEIFEMQTPVNEAEKYDVSTRFNEARKVIKVTETYSLQSSDLGNEEWDNQCTLFYSQDQNTFYTDVVTLNEVNDSETNEHISGKFPAIFLKKYAYVVIKGRWYMFIENTLYR